MNILVIDNYDSFTYNLVHILRKLKMHRELAVIRNDKVMEEDIEKSDKILLSPGPGLPKDAGKMPALIENYGPTKSILGVCLGHQGIAQNYGAQLHLMPKVKHGISTRIQVKNQSPLFKGLPEEIQVGHYHSWLVKEKGIPDELQVTAQDSEGNIMAIAHKYHDCRGVQFHPESILTEYGSKIINNWLRL